MKKILALLMAIMLVLSLAACGGNTEETTASADDTTVAEETTAAEETTEASALEKEIAEGDEGVGPVKLSNSYLSFEIPEGFGYYIDDVNQEAGEDQFQVIVELRNADGNRIGELLINNRGSLESADEYANVTIDEYKDSETVTVSDVDSATFGIFDVRHFTLDRGFMVDNRYFGYYQIPDENVEFSELREVLKEAINKLPPREKELVEAKFFKDKKLREISDEYGISQSRVSRIIQSGLNKMKKELQSIKFEAF